MLIIKNVILFLGKGPKQEIEETTLTAEAEYSIIFNRKAFIREGKKFCLSLHHTAVQLFIC